MHRNGYAKNHTKCASGADEGIEIPAEWMIIRL
jgi:hypothetical protein